MSFGLFLQELGAAMIALSLSFVKALTKRDFDKNKKMILLNELPIEILAHIFSFLPAKDIASISKVCKRFYDATRIEYVWMHRCHTEFGIKPLVCSSFSYKEVYTKILYKYGHLIGLWQPQVSCYGGLLQVKFKNGELVGTELLPPLDPHVTQPLRPLRLFVIRLSPETKQLELLCTANPMAPGTGPHLADIQFHRGNKFTFKCCITESHRQYSGRRQALMDWLAVHSDDPPEQLFPHTQELILMKFFILNKYNFCYLYWPIKLPEPKANVPIQPGLFKGTYGAHGIELIMLTYEEDGMHAQAVKISGDPNVPASQVTFQVDLHYPMVLTEANQESISTLESIQAVRRETPLPGPSTQPFRLPDDCFERFSPLPSTVTARYFGQGQIAGDGFTNPSFCHGHWMVFNEDLFGFLWLDLLSLSVYHRVKDFPDVPLS